MKKVLFTFTLIIFTYSIFASTDNDSPHISTEIAWDIGIGIASSAAGGVAAAGGNIPGALVGIANGAKISWKQQGNAMKILNMNKMMKIMNIDQPILKRNLCYS